MTLSIPDSVFRAGERLAKRMRVPRSQLYAMAVEAYVKAQSEAAITRRLNRVYSRARSRLDPALEAAILKVLRCERWD